MIQVIGRVFAILEELSLDGEVSLESLARITGLNGDALQYPADADRTRLYPPFAQQPL